MPDLGAMSGLSNSKAQMFTYLEHSPDLLGDRRDRRSIVDSGQFAGAAAIQDGSSVPVPDVGPAGEL